MINYTKRSLGGWLLVLHITIIYRLVFNIYDAWGVVSVMMVTTLPVIFEEAVILEFGSIIMLAASLYYLLSANSNFRMTFMVAVFLQILVAVDTFIACQQTTSTVFDLLNAKGNILWATLYGFFSVLYIFKSKRLKNRLDKDRLKPEILQEYISLNDVDVKKEEPDVN
jgi:hypothetical protein